MIDEKKLIAAIELMAAQHARDVLSQSDTPADGAYTLGFARGQNYGLLAVRQKVLDIVAGEEGKG